MVSNILSFKQVIGRHTNRKESALESKDRQPEISFKLHHTFENVGDTLKPGDRIEVWIGSIKLWKKGTFQYKQSPTAWFVLFDGDTEPQKKSKGVCFRGLEENPTTLDQPLKFEVEVAMPANKSLGDGNEFGYFNRIDWKAYNHALDLIHEVANELELEAELEERLQPLATKLGVVVTTMHGPMTAAELSGLFRRPEQD